MAKTKQCQTKPERSSRVSLSGPVVIKKEYQTKPERSRGEEKRIPTKHERFRGIWGGWANTKPNLISPAAKEEECQT